MWTLLITHLSKVTDITANHIDNFTLFLPAGIQNHKRIYFSDSNIQIFPYKNMRQQTNCQFLYISNIYIITQLLL